MRILLLTHAFNSLAQRLYVELAASGHELSVEFDINDEVTIEAVDLFRPDLIIAPFLKRAIPEAIWRRLVCLIVHPGIVGDRGPSALDRAVQEGETEWGVTVLQAEAEMDAGPIWATETFLMRQAMKSSLYRNEVTEAVVRAVLKTLDRWTDYRSGRWQPVRLEDFPDVRGRLRPLLRQADRAIDWHAESTATVIAKLHAADGSPGVRDQLFGQPCRLFNAREYPARGRAGEVIGRAAEGVVRATTDGAVWIGHVKRDGEMPIKLPIAEVFSEAASLPELDMQPVDPIRYQEADGVGYLRFDFYNGAMGTAACQRLRAAYIAARQRPTRVIVLMGGGDFFSNGLDLNRIEAAESPADESMCNIEAMDDLCREVIETDSHLTISALRGNAGAGGAYLALAADRVWARTGIVLNPHYRNMGNLYGSEYWTYLLPRRVAAGPAERIVRKRLPMGTLTAKDAGFIDDCFGDGPAAFGAELIQRTAALANTADFDAILADKSTDRCADEQVRPLSAYRADELAHLRRNFYGFDPSYHVARFHFVHKTPHSWTPRHLARHRDLVWQPKSI